MNLRSKLFSAAVCFALGLGGFAAAQIASSIQLSQDNRGNLGVDATGKHLLIAGSTPTLLSVNNGCGTSPTIVGNDVHGTITMGTNSPTYCTVQFVTAWGATPDCMVSTASTTATAVTASATSFTETQTGTNSNKFSYFCTSTQ